MKTYDPFQLYQRAHLWDVDQLGEVLIDIQTARQVLEDAEVTIENRQQPEEEEKEKEADS